MRFGPLLAAVTLRLMAMFGGGVVAYPNPGYVTGNITVHDPNICRQGDTWFLFSTDPGLTIRTSTDRINWTYRGRVWAPGQSPWTEQYTGQSDGSLWAPDCTITGGVFYLYYAASSFGSQNSAIFLAKSTTGLPGSWTDEGIVTSTTSANDYNAIDPSLLIDGDKWWLALGSWWTGIKLISLVPSTGKPASSTVYALAKRSNGIEGANLVKNGAYYYLFTSWDRCCAGLSSTYNVRVGRATNVTGPYVDQAGLALMSGGGTLVLSTHDSVVGPGGQSVYKDSDAWVIDYREYQDRPVIDLSVESRMMWLVLDYYTSTSSNLGINLLDFSSGWPVVY
ncbi:hypothetical protein FRC06_010738 [Ceratobasidium sp. 370]|nr:hypothetical protein FRC06_010738 [Ceratobasidium sp. 370]